MYSEKNKINNVVRVMEIKIMQLYNCNFSVNKICKVAEDKIMLFKKKSIKVMEIKVKQKNIKCFTKN